MNNKIIKTVDEHNIDRDGLILFSFQLDGTGYVCYSINRDEEQDNLFVSKVIKNFDDTFTMINIDSNDEFDKLKKIVMSLVEHAVSKEENYNG